MPSRIARPVTTPSTPVSRTASTSAASRMPPAARIEPANSARTSRRSCRSGPARAPSRPDVVERPAEPTPPPVVDPYRNDPPERLEKWIRNGCYAQVTGGSLLGRFGPGAQQTSQQWMARGLVHFVASDAHNVTGRPPRLREAYLAVRSQFGEEIAKALFVENPLAAFEGRALPYVPEIVEDLPKKKRFFFF